MSVRGCGLGHDHRVPEVLPKKLAPMQYILLYNYNKHKMHITVYIAIAIQNKNRNKYKNSYKN